MGRRSWIIFVYSKETVEKVEEINRPAAKKRKNLKLKTPIDHVIEEKEG